MKKFFLTALAASLALFFALGVVGFSVYWYNEIRWDDVPATFDGYYRTTRDDKEFWGIRIYADSPFDGRFQPTAYVRRADGVVVTDIGFLVVPENGWKLLENEKVLMLLDSRLRWPEGLPSQRGDDSEAAQRARAKAFVEDDPIAHLSGVLLVDERNRLRMNVDFEPRRAELRAEFGL